MVNKVLKTKYGTIKIYNHGYYQIISRKEGNRSKLLHRLIFEDFYGFKIPDGYVVHHKDGNKFNNCILNLQLLSKKEHVSLHHKDKNVSEESKRKIKENHADFSEENHPRWKSYTRIIKSGFKNGKQKYAIKKDGKTIKRSIYPSKLIDWFTKEYPKQILVLTDNGGCINE